MAESISEFEPSSPSEDDNVSHYHGDCAGDDDDDEGGDDDDTNHVKGNGCHGDISEHQHISDSQSISSAARLVTPPLKWSQVEMYNHHLIQSTLL